MQLANQPITGQQSNTENHTDTVSVKAYSKKGKDVICGIVTWLLLLRRLV